MQARDQPKETETNRLRAPFAKLKRKKKVKKVGQATYTEQLKQQRNDLQEEQELLLLEDERLLDCFEKIKDLFVLWLAQLLEI